MEVAKVRRKVNVRISRGTLRSVHQCSSQFPKRLCLRLWIHDLVILCLYIHHHRRPPSSVKISATPKRFHFPLLCAFSFWFRYSHCKYFLIPLHHPGNRLTLPKFHGFHCPRSHYTMSQSLFGSVRNVHVIFGHSTRS